MTFWTWLDKRWPSERAWVMFLLAVLIGSLLKMADHNPALWQVEVFKVIIQAAVLTGALNMVLAFYFTASKRDEDKTSNTGKLADAFKAVAESSPGTATEPLTDTDRTEPPTGLPGDPVHTVDDTAQVG